MCAADCAGPAADPVSLGVASAVVAGDGPCDACTRVAEVVARAVASVYSVGAACRGALDLARAGPVSGDAGQRFHSYPAAREFSGHRTSVLVGHHQWTAPVDGVR